MSNLTAISDCNSEETSWVIIAVIFGVIFLTSAACISYKFISIKNNTLSTLSPTKSHKMVVIILRYGEPTYLILVCITFILINTVNICICTYENNTIGKIVQLLLSLLLSLCAYGLQLIFFVKIYYVFKGTTYALSAASIIYFFILYSITPILYLLICVVYSIYVVSPSVAIILNTCVVLISITLIMSLIGLFVYKLRKVNRNNDKNDGKKNGIFVGTIKKTTILMSISILMKIFVGLFVALRSSFDAVSIFYIAKIFVYFNTYTDFLCVVLCDNQFNSYYMKICAACLCCDKHKIDKNENVLVELVNNINAMKTTNAQKSDFQASTIARSALSLISIGSSSGHLPQVSNKKNGNDRGGIKFPVFEYAKSEPIPQNINTNNKQSEQYVLY